MSSLVAMVTGANRGLGLEICLQLSALNMRVVMTARNTTLLDEAVATIGGPSDRLSAVTMNVTNLNSIEAARLSIECRFGPVDILINNAAIMCFEDEAVLSTTPESFEAALDTNLLGAVRTCSVFVPGMTGRGFGRVVNISSRAGVTRHMSTFAPAYSVSKAALNAFTKILAETCRGTGLLINACDPGWIRTDMGGPTAPRSVSEGADTAVWLATLPEDGPTGSLFRERTLVEW